MNALRLYYNAVVLLGIVLAVPAVAQSWPTYHGDYALTGFVDVALPERPVRRWRFDVEDRIDFTPVAGGGRIYVATARRDLVALDLTGKRVWRHELEGDKFSSPPMYTDDTVFIGTRKGTLLAFAAATGEPRWRYDVGGTIQGSANRIAAKDGGFAVIVTSQADGAIHCVNGKSGARLWKTGPIERCDGSPGVSGGRIILGSCAAAMHVFSIEARTKVADVALGDDNQVAGGVALAGDIAFAGSRSGKLFAVNVATETIVWTNGAAKGEAFTTPAIAPKHVVFGSGDGRTTCVNRTDGKTAWSIQTEETPTSPVIARDRVVVALDGELRILALADGKTLWRQRVSDYITSPAIVGDLIVVAADDGTVTAYGSDADAR